jgi:hypothetical protein
MDIPIGVYTDVIEYLKYNDILKLSKICLFINDIINNDCVNVKIFKLEKLFKETSEQVEENKKLHRSTYIELMGYQDGVLEEYIPNKNKNII